MKTKLLILALLITVFSNAQAPAIQWAKPFGGTDMEQVQSICAMSSGGYLIAGYTLSSDNQVTGNHGGTDCWIVKVNSLGEIQWQKTYGGTATDEPNSIKETPDGGFVFGGRSRSNNGDVLGHIGLDDYWLVKCDASGNIQWQKTYGGSNAEMPTEMILTTDGGYLLAGLSFSNNGNLTVNNGLYDWWILKVDAQGIVQWSRTIGGSLTENPTSAIQTADGGYIVAGISSSANGDIVSSYGGPDGLIVKLDQNGQTQWMKNYGGTGYESLGSIIPTDNGYIVAGSTTSTDGNLEGTGVRQGYDGWIFSIDQTGVIVWQHIFQAEANDKIEKLIEVAGGGYAAVGNTASASIPGYHGSADIWLIRLDAQGEMVWQKAFGSDGWDIASSIIQCADGGFMVGGTCGSNGGDVQGHHGGYDFFAFKLAAEMLGLPESKTKSPVIYPNPVYDVLNIETHSNITQISIINTTGKVVMRQENDSKQINLQSLPVGIYIIQTTTTDGIFSQKFIKDNKTKQP